MLATLSNREDVSCLQDRTHFVTSHSAVMVVGLRNDGLESPLTHARHNQPRISVSAIGKYCNLLVLNQG